MGPIICRTYVGYGFSIVKSGDQKIEINNMGGRGKEEKKKKKNKPKKMEKEKKRFCMVIIQCDCLEKWAALRGILLGADDLC